MRLLIADDNELARTVLASFLRDEGHEVFEAEDGVVAVSVAEREPLDAVLMDIQMPRMDGIAATQAIRANSHTRDARIFAFTGFPRQLGASEQLFTSVLVKPMSPSEVLDVIKPYLA